MVINNLCHRRAPCCRVGVDGAWCLGCVLYSPLRLVAITLSRDFLTVPTKLELAVPTGLVSGSASLESSGCPRHAHAHDTQSNRSATSGTISTTRGKREGVFGGGEEEDRGAALHT